MKDRIHCILTNVPRRDHVLHKFASVCGGKVKSEWNGVNIPAIVGNDRGMDEIQRACNAKKIPYLYIDHAYFQRDPGLTRFRLCVSGYHCSDWRASDREASAKVHAWNVKGRNVVVIEPAKKVHQIHPVKEWLDATMETLREHTDRKIVLKVKGDGDLCATLQDAWAAVCYGSVADVDAVRLGIPVFCGRYSPVWPVAQHDLAQIESPIYPDRAQWLRSLAGAEWNVDEMHLAWERVKPLLQSRFCDMVNADTNPSGSVLTV